MSIIDNILGRCVYCRKVVNTVSLFGRLGISVCQISSTLDMYQILNEDSSFKTSILPLPTFKVMCVCFNLKQYFVVITTEKTTTIPQLKNDELFRATAASSPSQFTQVWF